MKKSWKFVDLSSLSLRVPERIVFGLAVLTYTAPRLRRRLTAATSFCGDIGTRCSRWRPLSATVPLLLPHQLFLFEQSAGGGEVVLIAVLASSRGWSSFSGAFFLVSEMTYYVSSGT